MTEDERRVYDAAMVYGRKVKDYHAIIEAVPFAGFHSPEYQDAANAMEEADSVLIDAVWDVIKREDVKAVYDAPAQPSRSIAARRRQR